MRTTTLVRGALAVLAAAGAGMLFTRTPLAAAPPARLTPATYEGIKAQVKPRQNDLAWQQLHWRDGFFEGLLAAQAADKPMFYWLYEGDPRANC